MSKQFTAAAVLLLARDGKLSLDDPVRKYMPELPDYGVAADDPAHADAHERPARLGQRRRRSPAGRATTRAYTHAHVLDIVSRQKALNFTPGTALVLQQHRLQPRGDHRVARVSGQPFAEFTRERIFTPLGMTHTSWRDDYTRIVKRPRDRLRAHARTATTRTCRSRTCTATAAC